MDGRNEDKGTMQRDRQNEEQGKAQWMEKQARRTNRASKASKDDTEASRD